METPQFITGPFLQMIEEKEAKFLYDDAEKMLKDTLDTNTLIVTRVTTLTTVTSTLLVALAGFTIARYDAKNQDGLFATAIIGIVYLFVVSITLFLNIKPNAYYSIGIEPKDMVNTTLINPRNKSYRMIVFYINQIHEYQKRITYNKHVNSKRWRLYKISLMAVLFMPIVLGLSYIILS